ncbi:MAG: hypothetical protein ABR861_08250 [Terriglobales bacterium]
MKVSAATFEQVPRIGWVGAKNIKNGCGVKTHVRENLRRHLSEQPLLAVVDKRKGY